MPLLTLRINQPLAEADDLLKALSAMVAEQLGKPERYVMVALDTGATLIFAGDAAPAAYLELKSIGLPEDRTASLSAALCEMLASKTDIPADRIYIEFSNAERHLWGWNGATF